MAGVYLAIPLLMHFKTHPLLREILPSLQEDKEQNQLVCISQGVLGGQW